MCTSIISNRKKTIVGWNLDILNMEYRVRPDANGVYIEINDKTEGWMPLFGANKRGDFVGMPTCWPADARSDPKDGIPNIIKLDIDLLLQKKSFREIKDFVANNSVCSVPGLTFQAQLSDKYGNVLQIVPGQGYKYYEKPSYMVMTNFSPFKMNAEKHPWMGWDRYQTANKMLEKANEDFDVKDCFDILRTVSQKVCPTVVSMVFDVSENSVYWCEKQNWDNVKCQRNGYRIGKKILVLGCSGSGKSTFSGKLQKAVGLPLFHLDNIWWKPDRTHISREEFDTRLDEIICTDQWIIDGDYSRTYEKRIAACDTVFFLDFTEEDCMNGITDRIGKQRPDIPWTENALDPELVKLVQAYRTDKRPVLYELFQKYDRQIIIFKTRAEADRWLENY